MANNFRVILGTVIFLLVLTLKNGSVLGCSGGGGKNPKPTVDCPENECNDGKQCYTDKMKCDGTKDCDDNTDEDNHHCDNDKYPSFKNVTCSDHTSDSKYTLCFEVDFPGDGGKDHILLTKVENAFETWEGILKEEMNGELHVAFSLPDAEDGETNAVTRFHSMHVATCVSFEILLPEGKPSRDQIGSVYQSKCIKSHPHPENGEGPLNDTFAEVEEKSGGDEIAFRLNPKGYRVKVKVYYDDPMSKVYSSKSKVEQKLRSVMVYVEEMFYEKDTLTTTVQINAKSLKIEHLSGQSWVNGMSNHLSNSLQRNARNSKDEVNLYVFVTARGNGNPLGIAYVGTVCRSTRSSRVSINRYGIAGSQKNKVLYTAETIAHEMGHNLGMRHDFGRTDSRGKKCYGYMDYKDDTNYWSRCSVEDFTKTKKSCLAGGTGGGGVTQKPDDPSSPCENVPSYAKHCKQFQWACTDSRYPWFRDNCKKTCNAC